MHRIVILAAGKGTRMNSELPKVLVLLKNRPMIKYLLDSVFDSKLDPKPLIVVSPDNHELIKASLTDYDLEYVVQDKQLGTGHAVLCVQNILETESKTARNIVILYGDHPFLTPDSIKQLSQSSPETVTIMPTILADFNGWLYNFYHWGRVMRNKSGVVQEIKEFKDANESEKSVTEVNSGFMCFNKDWLFQNIKRLTDNNNQKEYYLTDMVKLAVDDQKPIKTVNIDANEAMGINSFEELQIAESLLL